MFVSYLVIILVTVLVSGSLLSYFVSNYLYRERRRQIIVQSQEISLLISAALGMPGSPITIIGLTDTFDRLLGAAVLVADTEGDVVITSRRYRSERGTRLSSADMDRLRAGEMVVRTYYDTAINENVFSVSVPIWVQGRLAGAVVVRTPLAGMAATLRGIRYELGRAALIAVIVSILMGLTLSRRISGPLRDVTRATRELASGNYGVTVPVRGSDELADLASSINELSARLKETINALIREKSQTQAILASMAEGVVAIDAEGRVLLANEPACRLLGLPPGSLGHVDELGRVLAGEPWAEECQAGSAIREALIKVVRENRAVQLTVEAARGAQLSVAAWPVRGGGGSSQGAVALLRDISEEVRQERNRREFLASISHELKTPLTSIRGFLQALVDGVVSDPDQVSRYYRLMLEETLRLIRLVNDLLDLSRLQSGVLKLRREKVEIAELVQEAVAQMLPASEEKGVVLETSVEEGLPVISADRDRLKQVLINLVDNAIRHTPSGGLVKITAGLLEEETGKADPGLGKGSPPVNARPAVVVHVKDTGPGIPLEEQPRIWERFYKVDKSRRRTGGGTGLGLAIVKELVELHGGRVGVTSMPGMGADFWFILPVYSESTTDGGDRLLMDTVADS